MPGQEEKIGKTFGGNSEVKTPHLSKGKLSRKGSLNKRQLSSSDTESVTSKGCAIKSSQVVPLKEAKTPHLKAGTLSRGGTLAKRKLESSDSEGVQESGEAETFSHAN